jgi:hypothetical protein
MRGGFQAIFSREAPLAKPPPAPGCQPAAALVALNLGEITDAACRPAPIPRRARRTARKPAQFASYKVSMLWLFNWRCGSAPTLITRAI